MTDAISKLHYITQGNIENRTHAQLAEQACKGGVDWVQLRVKGASADDWKRDAIETLEVCRQYGAKLIINDNPQLAVAIGADGVHLGKGDMSLAEARNIIGENKVLGATANTFEDIKKAFQVNINYIGLGPFRFTRTKDKLSPVLGLEGYQEIIRQMQLSQINVPIIAIGGILVDDIPELLSVGVHGVAIASGINEALVPSDAANTFRRVLS